MTIEEKAKAYDEALEQARFYHENCHSEQERSKLEGMFPSLCESKDERIRKFLVDEFERRKGGWSHPDISIEDILAWLERCKEDIENMPLDLVTEYEENRDLAGNAIGFINKGATYLNNRSRDEVIKWLESVPNTIKYLAYAFERLRKRKPVISKEAIRDGVIHFGITQYQIDNWLKKHINIVEQNPAEWSKEDRNRLEEAIGMIEANGTWVRSDDGVKQVSDFLKALPERFNLQQKQEWSEEDEKCRKWCISHFKECSYVSKDNLEFKQYLDNKIIPWFKSLCPQSKQMISEDTEVLMTKLVNLLKSYRIGEETATTLANRIADVYGTQRYMDGLCDSEKLHLKPSEEDDL